MNKKEAKKPPVSFPIKTPGQTKVWRVIESVKKGSQEAPIKITIQEIPEDRYEDILEHMCTYFIADEPICKCINGKNDPEYVATFRSLWTDTLKQGLSVGAFIEDPNGGKPILAGCNMLALSYEGEEHNSDEFASENSKRLMKVILGACEEAHVFEKYDVDRYLSALGLSVHPSYRGAALGGHILNTREDIGREYNIAVTATAFTSPVSQKLATRCGFETLFERNYDTFVDKKGNEYFPGIESKALKIMGKRLY